ncbi:MAG: hypothetical protein HOV96_17605 [Nonomuraea sp.]|nr:hypothetical protein [Nonomuraea sp.]NUR26652.1 hypothetical protein [Catenulispora sp.]
MSDNLTPRLAAPVTRTITGIPATDATGVELSWEGGIRPFAGVEQSWEGGIRPFAGVEQSWLGSNSRPFAGEGDE